MKNEFELAFNEISDLRTLDPQVVLEALQNALVSAYRKDTNASGGQHVEASIDPNTGRASIFVEKEVVEQVENPHTEVDLEEARFYNPAANYGDVVMVQVQRTTKNFGRIAAQTAKQVILQKIREAERNALYEEFISKEGDIIHATVQSVSNSHVIVNLNNRAEAKLTRQHQIPGERYKPGDKVRVYVLEVKRSNRGPEILVSRSHRNVLRRLLEFEVPEIYNGQVEIKNIAREAGGRSKVAVVALQDNIDPVGACVGMRGVRIQNIVKELHDEKIDVVKWNPNQTEFIQQALSPARVKGVYLEEDPDSGRTAVVIVPDDQLSLAIGKEGQNARLAAKLTGWRIDIKSVSEAVTSALEQIDEPHMAVIVENHAPLIAEARRIMEKRAHGLAVMPEEYNTLGQFADVVEQHLVRLRQDARQARIAEIDAVRRTLPQQAFNIPIDQLGLPYDIADALLPLENAGEIMLRFLIDEARLRRLLGNRADSALVEVQAALDRIVYVDEETPTQADEPAQVSASATSPAVEPAEAEPVTDDLPTTIGDDDYIFGDEPSVYVPEVEKPASPSRRKAVRIEEPDLLDEDDDSDRDKGKRRKDRQQRRHFIYDEDIGEVVVKRQRKQGRKRDEWGDLG